MKVSPSAFVLLAAISVATGHDLKAYGWEVLESRLPKKLSDHTASVASDGLMYIAGGCDSIDGNVYITLGNNEGYFACDSISSSFYSFDPTTRIFETLGEIPRPRYRHTSSSVGNQLWLIGGRDPAGDIIPEIDVYNIDSKSWSTVTLPSQYLVSDHASFTQEPSYVFIAGGYDQNYTAYDTLARIDTSTLGDDSLTIDAMAPLLTARGDISGAVASNGLSAFVTGGFTDANGFCAPLGSTEQYTFASNTWTELPNLINERGEVVLVDVNNHLYALGGERQIEGICDSAGDEIDPGEQTVGTDEVEVFENNAWSVISDFPNHRFRFAAAVDKDGLIFAFGGQTAYDGACQCFRTTDDVAIFGQVVDSSSAAIVIDIWVLAVAAAMFVATAL